jgi:hypothetical protein
MHSARNVRVVFWCLLLETIANFKRELDGRPQKTAIYIASDVNVRDSSQMAVDQTFATLLGTLIIVALGVLFSAQVLVCYRRSIAPRVTLDSLAEGRIAVIHLRDARECRSCVPLAVREFGRTPKIRLSSPEPGGPAKGVSPASAAFTGATSGVSTDAG